MPRIIFFISLGKKYFYGQKSTLNQEINPYESQNIAKSLFIYKICCRNHTTEEMQVAHERGALKHGARGEEP